MLTRLLPLLLVLSVALAAPAAPSVTVSPSQLQHSGDTAVVSWSGVESPTVNDTVAIFTAYASLSSIGWVPVTRSASWSKGSGSVSIPLVNMRSEYVLKYMAGGDKAVATSLPVTFMEGGDEVLQVHLALSGKVEATTASWASNDTTPHEVQWGTSATALDHSAPAVTTSYKVQEMCGSPANETGSWFAPGSLHTATIAHGFSTPTEVFYRVGSPTTGKWSTVTSFMTQKPVAADSAAHMAIFGDMGIGLDFITEIEQQPPSRRIMDLLTDQLESAVAAKEPMSVYHIGDISYARGHAFVWEQFFQQIQPVSSRAPWNVAIGNHESDFPGHTWSPSWGDYGTDSGGECGVPYRKHFTMPNSPSAEAEDLWYSVDDGNVHMIIVSTEHNFTVGSDQYQWLVSDLAAVNRSVTPWIIVGGHRPMYSSGAGSHIGNGVDIGAFNDHYREALEPLLNKYKVSMFFSGHVHAYERSCGISSTFQCASKDSDGVVHIVVGSAGNVYMGGGWQENLPQSPALQNKGHDEQPDWSIFRTDNFGYVTLDTTATELTLKFIGFRRGLVHDTLVLQPRV